MGGTGRFLVEGLRIDYAHTIAGLRVNEWTSLVAFVVAMEFVVTGRDRPDSAPDIEASAGTDS